MLERSLILDGGKVSFYLDLIFYRGLKVLSK